MLIIFLQTWHRRTDGRTDGRTDTPSYRDAWTHLKSKKKKQILFFLLLYHWASSYVIQSLCYSLETNYSTLFFSTGVKHKRNTSEIPKTNQKTTTAKQKKKKKIEIQANFFFPTPRKPTHRGSLQIK